MLHEPAVKSGPDPAIRYKMVLGAWMFLLYGLVYAGFVIVNLEFPKAMGSVVLFGLNLAVVYGIGLIFFALILAIIYNGMCIRRETTLIAGESKSPAPAEPVNSAKENA